MADKSQHFQIFGDVEAPIFAEWIARHAARLGLRGRITQRGAGQIELIAQGQADMLDALELGCSLGPREVWVERIERRPGPAVVATGFAAQTHSAADD